MYQSEPPNQQCAQESPKIVSPAGQPIMAKRPSDTAHRTPGSVRTERKRLQSYVILIGPDGRQELVSRRLTQHKSLPSNNLYSAIDGQ